MRKIKYLLIFLGFFIISSCKKDKDETVVVKDFTLKALTSKSWKAVLDDGNVSVNPKAGTYMYYALHLWEYDDIITFRTDDKVNYNYGVSKAPDYLQMPELKTYSIDLANKILIIDGVRYQILELSSSRLKYSLAVTIGGTNTNLVYMFEHP